MMTTPEETAGLATAAGVVTAGAEGADTGTAGASDGVGLVKRYRSSLIPLLMSLPGLDPWPAPPKAITSPSFSSICGNRKETR